MLKEDRLGFTDLARKDIPTDTPQRVAEHAHDGLIHTRQLLWQRHYANNTSNTMVLVAAAPDQLSLKTSYIHTQVYIHKTDVASLK